ncbi:ABC transporter transmembrane domain-containing protein, partial [Streptococcus pneumoniae]
LLDLFGRLIFNQKGLISTVILASFVLSIIGILSSLFSKVIMDEVIPYALKNSLYMFLIVFGIVSFLQTLLSAFRQHVLLFLSRKIDIPVLMGYYDHIIHLPYSFF